MTRTLLLALHITSVAAWLGANFVQLVLAPRFAKEPTDVALAWTRHTNWLGERYYIAVGVLVGVSGVLLVLDGPYDWDAGFVWLGISVVVIGAILGGAVLGPLGKQRLEALESGDQPRAAAVMSRIVQVGLLDTVLILLTVLAMVDKWMV
jgi:hypothetical protein